MTNLFKNIPQQLPQELIEVLAQGAHARIERIVSRGHATPPGEWCDQPQAEWVMVVQGRAKLLFEGERAARELNPGDCTFIPAHTRHRVEWTDPQQETIWIAAHFS